MMYCTSSGRQPDLKTFLSNYPRKATPTMSTHYDERKKAIQQFIAPFIQRGPDGATLDANFVNKLKTEASDGDALETILDIRKDLYNAQSFGPLSDDLIRLDDALQSFLKGELAGDDLICQPIDPMFTHPTILKRLIEHEAVHPYSDPKGIFDRIRPGRLCLVLFHRRLPMLPLMSLYIALTEGIASNMDVINSPHVDLTKIDSAMFYSISSLHSGLKNVDLGHLLIGKATEYLMINPSIKNFCTLSPIPNFKNYLKRRAVSDQPTTDLLAAVTFNNLESYKFALLSSCLRYIMTEKKRNNKAMDPVCNFHLKNGASVYRLNWRGDMSEHRLNESYGIMINYLYQPDVKKANSQNYKQNGTIIHQDPLNQLAHQLNITI
ncbi:hypothetical protein SAMD00019534_018760, partial [Acytostelium subglobosum LB1]|uniref:hypothetical protein n=1 Tax=Acytostelium subglobosum LB1 TaxID=1410327 RepID=UPI000644F165